MNKFKIGNISIGAEQPAFVIAEIAQAHDGSLGTAHAYVDAVAKTGANAIKFQTHIADAESSIDENFRANIFPQDASRYDYWKRMEFSAKQWRDLADHAVDRGLIFLSSPFSMQAVDLLNKLSIPAWKIGSGETSNHPMLNEIIKTGKPVLLSTGMSSWAEIDESVKILRDKNCDFALFQCTTSYPCPPEKIGLNIIIEMQERYNCPIGLSDHSGTIFPSLAAVALGAKLVEVHTVFSRACFGPDVGSSVTLNELTELVRGIRHIESALRPVDKDDQSICLEEVKKLFGKSLYVQQALPAGHVLSREDLALKKPGTGIPARRLLEIVGKRITKPYQKDEQLRESDLQ